MRDNHMTFKQYVEAKQSNTGNYVSIGAEDGWLLSDSGYPFPESGNEVTVDKQHVTLIYSKESSLSPEQVRSAVEATAPDGITAQAYEFAAFDSLPKDGERDVTEATLVLKLKSPALVRIHEQLKSMGLSHSYPEFSPHLSLWYGVEKRECDLLVKILNRVVDTPFGIDLAGYTSNEVIEDWGKA